VYAANITLFGARSIAAKFSWAISPNGLEIMRKAALKYRAELFAREILPDHVHMLCEVDPQLGIHRFVKNIKGVTSHHLRKEFVSLRRRLPFSICGARLFSPLTTARARSTLAAASMILRPANSSPPSAVVFPAPQATPAWI
jgi:hypothetical protein